MQAGAKIKEFRFSFAEIAKSGCRPTKSYMNIPMSRIYLDHNATGPLRPEARTAILAALDVAGNASSVHADGRAARGIVERAREQVAALVGAEPRQVVFTSGGTEAACLALTPSMTVGGKPIGRLLMSAGEHPCVLSGHRFGPDAVAVPLLANGVVDLEALTGLLAAAGAAPPVLALQAANNETGVLQPVREAADLVHARGGVLICDAVQAAGRTPVSFQELGGDALILSAHKFGGPKGVGALVIDHRRLHIGETLVRGGGQERGMRGGTENVAAIAGFGAASEAAGRDVPQEAVRLAALRDAMETRLRAAVPGLVVFGEGAPRLPNTSAFAAPGTSAETMLIALDLAGVSLSSGSACSSGKVRTSHVLTAMDVAPDLAKGALRVSLGWTSAEKDTEGLCHAYEKAVSSMRARRDRPAA